MRISIPRRVAALSVGVALVAGLAVTPAAKADTPAVDRYHYTYVRVDYPAAHLAGELATNAQAVNAARRSTAFWGKVAGAPRLSYDVVPGVLDLPGTPNPCPLCGDMKAEIETALGRPVGGLVIFFKTGYPSPHYTGQAMIGEDMVAMYGAFAGDGASPGWDPVAHEIGHNLGFNHDTQNPSKWTPAEFCGYTSYWNPFSIMGGGEQAPSGVQQARLGWLTPYPFPVGTAQPLWDIRTSVWSQARVLEFVANNHTFDLEYRPAASNGSPPGVVLYRNGQAVEVAGSQYVLTEGKVYKVGGGLGVQVRKHGKSGNLLFASVRLVRV